MLLVVKSLTDRVCVDRMSNTKQVVYLFWSKCKDKQLVQVPH